MVKYNWTLKNAIFTKDKGTVFSCFACGGGSSMGYKLAGFDVIGANDIDKKMSEVYQENHKPKYFYLESITTLAKRKDLPKEFYNLDILDGSPPCSSFSISGNREKDWGKEKKFREGQVMQVLDTLFFDFIDLAKELKPKVVIAENVEGLMQGNAIHYVRKIYEEFENAGYYCQHFLFDASKMGVPQKRKRVFFICLRKDLAIQFLYQKDIFTQMPKINFSFNEKKILFGDFYIENDISDRPITGKEALRIWNLRQPNDDDFSQAALRDGRLKFFSYKFLKKEKTPQTLPAHKDSCFLYDEPRRPNKREVCCIGSFPQDFNFLNIDYGYIVGMSVPPLMTYRISKEIYKQWLSKI